MPTDDQDAALTLALIKHGVASDIAFSLSNDARAAMLIIFGELDGRQFDWLAASNTRPSNPGLRADKRQ
jgi:hypothetical protein